MGMDTGSGPIPRLVWIRGGPYPGRSFDLRPSTTVLGRDSGCDIVLDTNHVSKRHARIVREADGYYVEDLGSKNGTRLDGAPVVARVRLRHGSTLELTPHLAFRVEGVDDDEPGQGDDRTSILGILETPGSVTPGAPGARPEEKLRAVLGICNDLVGVLDLGETLDRVLGALFRIFPQADRAFVLRKGREADVVIPEASRSRRGEPEAPTVSRTVLRYVLERGKAILSEDVQADSRFGGLKSVFESRSRTMMCAPLWDRARRPVGALLVDTCDHLARFTQDDLDLLAAVAAQVSVAVENADLHRSAVKLKLLEQECRHAREVHRALLPRRRPAPEGYEFWDFYEPALYVGGDYFDYIPLGGPGAGPGRWAVALADVAGKGIPAALLTARLTAQVRLLLATEPDPARFLARLNQDLCDIGTAEKFITFLLVVVDAEVHELTAVSAGHMAPLVRRVDGRIERIGEEGEAYPLAIFEGQSYRAATAPIGPGDVVVLYTDGVIEAVDPAGRGFQAQGLERALAAAPAGPGAVGGAVVRAVLDHAEGCAQLDDITLLCFGRT